MRQVTGPRDLPWFRHHLLEAIARQAERYSLLPAELMEPDSTPALMESASRAIAGGSLWWVSADMTRVALDASQDLPDWTVRDAMPDTAGLLWWDGELPLMRVVDEHGSMTRTRMHAVMWSVHAGNLRMVPVVLADDGGWLMPASVGLPLEASGLATARRGTRNWPDAYGVLCLLGATWTLMMQPQVAERRHRDQPGKDIARARRQGWNPSPITVVDLRPMRTVSDPDAEAGSGRRLHVRHVVRGHWRQQWYPSTESHRPRWIASYLKGPEGAPIKATTPVMVWRR